MVACLAILFLGLATSSLHALTSTADLDFPSVNGPIYGVAQGGDTILIGGAFSVVDGVGRARIAALDAYSGQLWDWNPNITDGFVYRIHIVGDKVYVGGSFSDVNGVARNRMAAFNLPTHAADPAVLDPAWDPDVNGTIDEVASSGGKIYICGNFTTVSGVTRNYAAALSPANGVDAVTVDPWHPDFGGRCRALLPHGNRVYCGGPFTTVKGGTARNRLAAFEPADGVNTAVLDEAWSPNVGATAVYCLASDGVHLYLGGDFISTGGNSNHGILSAVELANGLNTGAVIADWDPPLIFPLVRRILIVDEFVIALGSFVLSDHNQYLVAFQRAALGYTLDPWAPTPNGVVYDGTLSGAGFLVAGGFTTMEGVHAPGKIAGFNSTVPVRFRAYTAE